MANMEINTNRHLRKKYFVDANSILVRKKSAEITESDHLCRVIDAQQVRMAKDARRLGVGPDTGKSGRMNVQMIKNGDRIEQVRVTCPCGRHVELDCRYEPVGAARTPDTERTHAPERKGA